MRASIAAEYVRPARVDGIDHERIVGLYGVLEQLDPSPFVRLNRAVAVANAGRTAEALEILDSIAGHLHGHHLLSAVRGHLLRRLGRRTDAADAFRDAAESAREAEGAATTERGRHEAVRTGAQAHHWRGMSYEAASRPRAAREAYRAARTEWSRLPEGSLVADGPTAAGTAERLAALERVT